MTHTRPFPPPGAGVAPTLAPALVFVELTVVAGAAEGDGLTELLGLKKSASVLLAGDGDGITVGETAAVVFPLRACFSAGEGDAAVAAAAEALLVTAGAAVLVALAFL